MAIFDFLKNCGSCNKSGLFTKLDSDGYCPECAAKRQAQAELKANREKEREEILMRFYHSSSREPDSCVENTQAISGQKRDENVVAVEDNQEAKIRKETEECISKRQAQAELKMRREEDESRRIKEQSDPSFLLEKVARSRIIRPAMHQGIPMVYDYVASVTDVNRSILYEMTQNGVFSVELSACEDGSILLIHDGASVAKLADKVSIVTDWLKNGDPYICQFSTFHKGDEHVLLHLYRDDESRMKNSNVAIAKLTSCMSEEKQDNIMCLEEGQKLFVDEDDNGKWYVRDINYHDIGRMPAKFNRMYDDGSLRGLFFDHTETTENSNGDERAIPYVRFYYD